MTSLLKHALWLLSCFVICIGAVIFLHHQVRLEQDVISRLVPSLQLQKYIVSDQTGFFQHEHEQVGSGDFSREATYNVAQIMTGADVVHSLLRWSFAGIELYVDGQRVELDGLSNEGQFINHDVLPAMQGYNDQFLIDFALRLKIKDSYIASVESDSDGEPIRIYLTRYEGGG